MPVKALATLLLLVAGSARADAFTCHALADAGRTDEAEGCYAQLRDASARRATTAAFDDARSDDAPPPRALTRSAADDASREPLDVGLAAGGFYRRWQLSPHGQAPATEIAGGAVALSLRFTRWHVAYEARATVLDGVTGNGVKYYTLEPSFLLGARWAPLRLVLGPGVDAIWIPRSSNAGDRIFGLLLVMNGTLAVDAWRWGPLTIEVATTLQLGLTSEPWWQLGLTVGARYSAGR